MRYIFVHQYLEEIGIKLTKEDLDWFEDYVKGVLDLDRYLLLYALCKYKGYKTALEIGCAGGGASKAMVKAGARVVGIDIKPKCSNGKNLAIIKGDSLSILPEWIKNNKAFRFDLIFIDGSHNMVDVPEDIKSSEKLAKKIIVVHDYNLEKGVTAAVDSLWGKPKQIIKDNRKYPTLEAGIVIKKI